MGLAFLDELRRIARPYDDEEDDNFDEFESNMSNTGRMDRTGVKEKPMTRQEPASLYEPERRNNKVVNIHTTTQLQVVLVKPERFENAAEIADHLREKRTVVLNLESTKKDVARRLLDFLSGVAYAQEGKI